MNYFIKIMSILMVAALFGSVVGPAEAYDIDADAFEGCENLQSAAIPSDIQSIAEGAFDDCPDDFLIVTGPNDGARGYAITHSIDYKITGGGSTATQYRALVIGQEYLYTPGWSRFDYARNDAVFAAAALNRSEVFGTTPFTVSLRYELSANEILSQISSTFANAGPEDVSLLFYSGHGAAEPGSKGALVGADGAYVTPAQLRSAMDAIPGRKILLINCCFSGVYANAFRNTLPGEYYVLTSSAANSESYAPRGGLCYFTYYLLMGIGYNPMSGRTMAREADGNENGVITLKELYDYITESLSNDANLEYLDVTQVPQVWPANSTNFGLFRE